MDKIEEMDRRDGIYSILPMECAQLLGRFKKNRPIRTRNLTKIRAALRQGKFILNGSTLVLDSDGNPLDGQHRLKAAVQEDVPLVTYVVHLAKAGVAVFDTIDSGASRTISDVLDVDKYHRDAAAMLRLIVGLETGRSTFAQPSPDVNREEARVRWAKDPSGLMQSITFVRGHDKGLRPLIGRSYVTAIHYIGKQKHREKADLFVERLADGNELSKRNPIHGLRNRLISQRGTKTAFLEGQILAMTIKTWNAVVAQKEIGNLKVDIREQFPRIAF